MSVSLGFISYTMSVLRNILPGGVDTSAENSNAGNTEIGTLTLPNTDNLRIQENQLNEIIAQATGKLLENVNPSPESASAVLPPISASDNKADELSKTLKDSISTAAKEVEKFDSKPVEEYEDVTVTEYYLKHYYGQEDYTKFKQKIDKIEFKEQSNKESDRQKIQKELLEREKLDFQKAEFERINLKAIRDFQEKIYSDKLKDSKKD